MQEEAEHKRFGSVLWFQANQIGSVLLSQEKRARALESYHVGLDVAERLAKSDPENADLQLDLSEWHKQIAEVLHAQGVRQAALERYRASLDIMKRLVKPISTSSGNRISRSSITALQTLRLNLASARGHRIA